MAARRNVDPEPITSPLLVHDIAVGDGFSCALLDAGIKCWGFNGAGELGLGDTQHRGGRSVDMGDALPYVDIIGVVQAVDAGGSDACAIGGDGAVTCWGADYGTKRVRVPMPSSKSARAVASGGAGQCAVLYDSTVTCWKSSARSSVLPVAEVVNVGAPTQQVYVGGDHACVILADGGVKCWGSNGQGELGIGSAESRRSVDQQSMGKSLPRVELGANRTARSLALGPGFSCAILDNGFVKCWGDNESGRLGRPAFGPGGTPGRVGVAPNEMGDALAPIDFGAGKRATAIAVGRSHGCALMQQGEIVCWGRGYEPKVTTVELGHGLTVRALAAGWDTSCALTIASRVKCWGRNDAGQLGLGDVKDRASAADWGERLNYVNLGLEKKR